MKKPRKMLLAFAVLDDSMDATDPALCTVRFDPPLGDSRGTSRLEVLALMLMRAIQGQEAVRQ